MPTQLSRRRILALVGSGSAVAVAGCQTIDTADDDSEGDDGSSSSASTDSSDSTATATATSDATATRTQTSSRTPTTTPIQEYFRVETNDSTKRMEIEFTSTDRMQVFEIQITGAERARLNQTDFEERDVGGGYVYSGEYQVNTDGTYSLSFTKVVGSNIDDPPYNREQTVSFDLSAPVLLSFRATNPSESELQIRAVVDERLSELSVDVRGVGGYRDQFTRSDFTESETTDGSYAYETTVSVDQSGRYILDLEYVEDRFQNREELSERFYATVESG